MNEPERKTLRLKRPEPMDGDPVTDEIRRLLQAQDDEGEQIALALATLPD